MEDRFQCIACMLEMNNPDSKHLNILSLPDESFFIIFQKSDVIDALHSLVDVNRRFQQLVVDRYAIWHLIRLYVSIRVSSITMNNYVFVVFN